MLYPTINLDAAMPASAALARLARYGLWLDESHQEAQEYIQELAKILCVSPSELIPRLRQSSSKYFVVIRRQLNANVSWYARGAEIVLARCVRAKSDIPISEVLLLNETGDSQTIDVSEAEKDFSELRVVIDGMLPVAVNFPSERAATEYGADRQGAVAVARALQHTEPLSISAWPLLKAPKYVPARQPFSVVVGLSGTPQSDIAGNKINLSLPAGADGLDVSIELLADGLDAPDGWTRILKIDASNPLAATVAFQLIGHDPAGPEPFHLTLLEVRYVLDGTICGVASRPLVIGGASVAQEPHSDGRGRPWTLTSAQATPVELKRDENPVDLTIEIAKPTGDVASGHYQCRLYSPHGHGVNSGPFSIDLGHDAKTFAQSNVVRLIRDNAGKPLLHRIMLGIGTVIAEKLPEEVFAALKAIAELVRPRPPAVLLVTADPYVPWELARMDKPLDSTRPPFMGAQTIMGRWLCSSNHSPQASPTVRYPPARPPSRIYVRYMAVMAGQYMATTGLKRLPKAEEEASMLVHKYDAVPLKATQEDVARLLDAQLTHKSGEIYGADVVHFAGHGDIDPAQSDASVLMLSDGRPLPSVVFRSANFGRDRHPFMFLNACLIGIGGELLGDMGGFPGNCLQGGFGGFLGALWEVDDNVAHDIAMEFWRRAMPPADEKPVEIGAILRDMRARYASGGAVAPVSTYMAYVFYGHPRLTLQRIPLGK